jgi:hypothetical protein
MVKVLALVIKNIVTYIRQFGLKQPKTKSHLKKYSKNKKIIVKITKNLQQPVI